MRFTSCSRSSAIDGEKCARNDSADTSGADSAAAAMPAGELLRRSWPTRATRAPVRATMRMISRGRRHCRRRVRPVKGGRARRMAILIRTSDVPAAQHHDAWRSVVCETLGPLDLRSDPGTPLRGEIEAGQLGPVNVGRVKTSTPHSVYRTPGLIRRDSPELYRVALAMSGTACLLQDGRAAQLRPGEFTLYDFTRPYEVAYDSGVQLAVFSFPREMLALPMDLVAKLTAVPISAD